MKFEVKWFKWLRSNLSRETKGQSLVEMAIMTPLLLLFFIGVFEVGYALRGYLVLVNANREITRFSVRPDYLDFSQGDIDPDSIGYDTVMAHTYTVLGADPDNGVSGQLPIVFDDSSTLIISHIVADTNQPCTDITKCDCSWFEDLEYRTNPGASKYKVNGKIIPLISDDDLRHPGMPGQEFQAKKYPEDSPEVTRLNYEEYVLELARENDKFNCELLKKGGGAVPSVNNVVVTELFFDQPQLVGLPVVSNYLTDPISMYSHTAMRLTAGARGNTADTVGPGCDVWPVTFPEEKFNPNNVPQTIDAYEGGGTGQFGWLKFDPSNNDANYVEDEMTGKIKSQNEFIDPTDPSDTTLNLNDYMGGLPGVNNSSGVQTELQLAASQRKTVFVPVYASTVGSGGGISYYISHIAEIQIEAVCLPSNGSDTSCGGGGGQKKIVATFLGYRDKVCGVEGGSSSTSNDPPTALDDAYSAVINGSAQTLTALSNDSDPDGDTLTVTDFNPSGGFKGNLVNNGDGTFTYTPPTNSSQAGNQTFTYDISDGNGGTDTATVTIVVVVSSAGNHPPFALGESYSTDQSTDLNVPADGVLGNDIDPDGDPLTAVLQSGPSHGTVTLNTDGSFTYTPTGGYSGADSFTYTANDGTINSDAVTVNITVVQANSPPVAVDDIASTIMGITGTVVVSLNDTDPDGDPLTYSIDTPPTLGTLVPVSNGQWDYIPGSVGTDSFTYEVSDGRGGTDTATVSITITAAPIAMHVAAVTVTQQNSGNSYWGNVVVRIEDAGGNPVQGATVSGEWTVAPNNSQEKSITPVATNASGQISASSDAKNDASGTYTFCVTGVTKFGVTYNSATNVETCDSN